MARETPASAPRTARKSAGEEKAALRKAALLRFVPYLGPGTFIAVLLSIGVPRLVERLLEPKASCPDADLDNLKRKVDAGADRAISQFFFSPDAFLRFRDRAAARGIAAEIVPGILPVSNVAQTRKFAGQCGAGIPEWMDAMFEGLDDHPTARQLIAATVAAELCGQLYAGGVRHFHFYTLNRAELAYAICHLLGVRAKVAA